MRKIRCVVERITYQNPENGYSVLKCRVKDYDDLVPVIGNLKSLQIEAYAHLIEPFSEEYNKVLEFKKIPVEAMQKLPQPLHLLKIYPESYDYLDSDLKKEGFEVRQHRGKYYN